MTSVIDFSIFDYSREGCQIIGPDFQYLYVNNAAVNHGKKMKADLIGHKMMEAYPGIEKTVMFSSLKKCMDKRKSIEMEYEFEYPDHTTAWFSLRMTPVPEGVFIFSMDITAQKKTEIGLQNQIRHLEAIRDIDIIMAGISNLSLTLKTVVEKVAESLEVDAADILLLNPQSMKLEFKAGYGFRTKGIEKSVIPLGKGLAGHSAINQKTVFVADLSNANGQFNRTSLIKREGFISYCVVPLIFRGKLVGALEIFNRSRLTPNKWWFDFMNALGEQAFIENAEIFQDLQTQTASLQQAYDSSIADWSRALDLKGKETEGHTLRVAEMTVKLARMARISEEEIVHIRRGALLHDIGNLRVPDAILQKPASLTEDEWVVIRKHPVYAYELLYPFKFLRPALPIPHFHHERWDGTGYPSRLKGEKIPLAARLFAVVDVYDVLSYDRPYRPAWPQDRILDYIQEKSTTHFDPMAVRLFLGEGGNKVTGIEEQADGEILNISTVLELIR